MVINPNNPTGAVYPDDLLRELVEIARQHQLIVFADEIYDKTLYDGVTHTAIASLAEDVLFVSFNGLSTPPANTQTSIKQAPQCLDTANAAIDNTACVLFNSRGMPIDDTAQPVSDDAVYLTDASSVQGVIVSGTGMIRSFKSPANTARWSMQ